jgi:hypothetical protein
METNTSVSGASKPINTWVRNNVVDVAPLWAQFLQSALANVRIGPRKRQWLPH